MIHLDYNSTKVFTFYLQPSISSPTYLLSFVNYTTRTRKNCIAPATANLSEMLQLTVTEVGTGTEHLTDGDISLSPMGAYVVEVYEQSNLYNLDIDNATFLGDDVLIVHKAVTYDAPPLRNIILPPNDVCTIVVDSVTIVNETSLGADDGTATAVITGNQGNVTYAWTGPMSLGNALEFDGVNDFVSFTEIPIALNQDFTLSFWIKENGVNAPVWMRGATLSNYIISSLGSNIIQMVFTAGGTMTFTTPAGFIKGVRQHVVIKRSGSSIKAYFNGVESTTGTQTNNTAWSIAGISNYAGFTTNGIFDGYGILLDTAASIAQIAALYNGGIGADFDSVMGSSDVYYKLNESGATTTAVDSSGNGNNGTLNNFTEPMWVEGVVRDGAIYTSTSNPITGLETGEYTVIATDDILGGCTATNSGTVLAGGDIDANVFIANAGITGGTQQDALNQLFLDLKGLGSTTNDSNVYSDLLVAYPMCPVDDSTFTRDAMKYNMLNPLDTDAAFRIDWFNSPVASNDGITGNASNMYGDSHFDPSVECLADDVGATVSANMLTNGALIFGAYIGVQILGFQRSNSDIIAGNGHISERVVPAAPANNDFIMSVNRTSDTLLTGYNDGVSTVTNVVSGNSLPIANLYALSNNNGSAAQFSSGDLKFMAVHNSLSANQTKDLYDAINKFNIALGR